MTDIVRVSGDSRNKQRFVQCPCTIEMIESWGKISQIVKRIRTEITVEKRSCFFFLKDFPLKALFLHLMDRYDVILIFTPAAVTRDLAVPKATSYQVENVDPRQVL